MSSQECPEPQSNVDLALGTFLLVGTLVSFLPQHIRLFMRKSHVGLSLGRVIVGAGTGTASVIYFVALESYGTFNCCNSPLECYSNVLNFSQILTAVLCDMGILVLFVVYFDHEWLAKNHLNEGKLWRATKIAVGALLFYQLALVVSVTVLLLGPGPGSPEAEMYGYVFIGVTSIGQVVQWVPQIWKSYTLRHIGSLSIPMVVLQAVGAGLTAYFTSTTNPAFYFWLPFAISSLLATILSVQTLYYWYHDRKEHVPDILEQTADGEDKPLLVNQA